MASERNTGARRPAVSRRAARDDRRSALPPLRVFATRVRVGALIGGRTVRQAATISAGHDTDAGYNSLAMEIRVRERLVGALVLVTIVVLLVPALLKGPERAADAATGPEIRSVVVQLDDADQPAQDEVLVPEPPQPQSAAAQTEALPPPPARKPAPGGELHGASPPAAAATNQPAEPAPAASAAVETPAWAIQLGAFSTREKADDLVANLRKRGYRAFVLEYRASGKVLHRVRVGPEQDRERAVAIAERLRKDGFQPVVAPHP